MTSKNIESIESENYLIQDATLEKLSEWLSLIASELLGKLDRE